MRGTIALRSLGLGALSLVISTVPAFAQSVEQFYRGRTVNLIVGFNPGGAYDPYARPVARHLPKHLPGAPNGVVKNIQGAGSVLAADPLYNLSPKDGSGLGLIARQAALDPMPAPDPVRWPKFT